MNIHNSAQEVDSAVSRLTEHFDCILVLASRLNPTNGNTEIYVRGTGNYYARVGMAREFLDRDTATITKDVTDQETP